MIEQNARQTKVIKSFEGKALTAEEAQKVAQEEVDVLRCVYDAEAVPGLIEFVKTVTKLRTPTALLPIMLDLSSWVQATVGNLKEPRDLPFGTRVTASAMGGKGDLQFKTERFDRLFAAEARAFLGSGMVTTKVVSFRPDLVELEVTQGGTVYPDAELFVPDTRKDPSHKWATPADLEKIVPLGIDFLILPGHWTTQKLREFKTELQRKYGEAAPWLLCKIDSESVYMRLEEVIHEVDGVLISRRELALSTNPATVPMITKEIIQVCNDMAKIVVTASELLASMRRNVTPTRAEVSDIANATIDGTDAVVLSEEVSNGKYGAQAVAVTHRIIRDIESQYRIRPNWVKIAPRVQNEMDAVAYHAYRTAERIKAKAIVCVTVGGNTALKLASYRAPMPIIAVTFKQEVVRRLALVRGVEALLLDIEPKLDEVLPLVSDKLVRGSWLRAGDPIIFVSITLSPVGKELSNLFSVQRLT